MHELIAAELPGIGELCRSLGVRRLDLFGSAVDDSFDIASSDVDVLVEFDVPPDFDRFFALKEGLERILGRPVDLVSGSSIRNPYFRQRVMETGEQLYAA
ncbi:nucleotidyltransferase family protein [Saccharothrix coeruleofusca]|uniref:Polymerase nucleotidyl transferase domain-containing protein n=1 Tax=Saccharothrix coeruleofusca TaxID=33919 RepID=A0A918EDP0_9PSEU|nr:nucleotidyltransferase domain-containing protein [Saccharothrix coeruleofusca]GGP59156.1 hypothetical protein GCM10010185_34570 [Saccharothrix coeruleofusca]